MKRLLFTVLLGLALGSGSIRAAQVDYYIRIVGIDGESTDDRHKNEIEILSFSWGLTQTGSFGSGASQTKFSNTSFTTRASKASPKLMLACATGQPIPSMTFVINRPNGDTNVYYRIEMKEVFVTSYQSGGHGGGGSTGDVVPTDQFSVNFAQIKFEHTSTDGTITSAEAVRPTTLAQ